MSRSSGEAPRIAREYQELVDLTAELDWIKADLVSLQEKVRLAWATYWQEQGYTSPPSLPLRQGAEGRFKKAQAHDSWFYTDEQPRFIEQPYPPQLLARFRSFLKELLKERLR